MSSQQGEHLDFKDNAAQVHAITQRMYPIQEEVEMVLIFSTAKGSLASSWIGYQISI
jgi:hypothetical protein